MLRRSHKKSRGGCLECKLRHVKCDEGQPICRLCTLSERECSFATQGHPSENLSAPDTSSHERSISPGDSHRQVDSPLITAPSLLSADANSPGDTALDEALNLDHMALVIHLTTSKEMFNLSADVGDYPSNISFALRTGLTSPHLLHELLAFSARHLAFLHPECSAAYLHQAVALQTRAVSLFNAAWAGVDRSNCVAVLLFSSILGHHLFADTLAQRGPVESGGGGRLEAFIAHYVQCVRMHRGIHTVAISTWPLLMESELRQTLSWSRDFNAREPRGDHCRRLRELVDGAAGLGDEDKEACRLAIRYLQVGFDTVLAEDGEGGSGGEGEGEMMMQGSRYQMLFSWSMLAPPEFTRLLAARRPEVLVLLAYYALLLHHGRGMWQVGDAGVYLLGLIGDYLGPGWDYWLEYPREGVAREGGLE